MSAAERAAYHRAAFESLDYRDTTPLYVSEEGGTTTDITKAKLHPVTKVPMPAGFSHDSVRSKVYDKVKPLSYSPNIPGAREAAALANSAMNALKSTPQNYYSKTDAIQQANNAANAFLEKVESLNTSE